MIGTTVSHYKVVRQLGRGGMGEVYEAVDESLGRKVAIKILLPQYAKDPEVTARFFNEARSVNLIRHPGLVQVFEFGRLPDDSAFMVMEFIDGVTLRDRMKSSEHFSEMETLQVGLQLSSALAATHAKNIVHRDLKPGNVMIVADPTMPNGERIKLLDFGIAKLSAESARDDQPRTRTGLSIGTPAYMSPEQCRGLKTLDGKADVYSLGVMMYQMLARQLPFDGEADGAIMGQHMYEEPRPILSLAPYVSRSVAALVHRMLRKQPEQRPSAKELEEILTEMAAAVVPSAARPSAKLKVVASLSSSSQWDARELNAQNHSTLGRSAGELAAPASVRLSHLLFRLTSGSAWLNKRTSPRQRQLGLAALLLLVVGALTGGVVASLRTPKPEMDVVLPLKKVRWQLSSVPPGARVVRKSDQKVLGQTPWTQEQPAGAGPLELLLQLPGYKDRAVLVDQSRDAQLSEAMEQLPADPNANAASHKRGKKGAKPEVEEESGKRREHRKRVKLID